MPVGRPEAETAPGTCPDCRAVLEARALGPIRFEECARCGALFLSSAAFDAAARDADTRSLIRAEKPPVVRAPGAPLPRVKYRPCPACGRLMNRQNYAGGSGIVVDVCRDHGVFFDRGELTAIVDFLEAGGWDRMKRRERERLEEEVRHLEERKSFAESIALPASDSERDSQALETARTAIDFLGRLFRR